MKISRKEFTSLQRAEIYARDRATCCFSGANLWLLDAPLRPGNEHDWADHIRPLAKGGLSETSNGVCSGHTFNYKKRHNASDKEYLFENGIPTWRYFQIFGPLQPDQTERTDRLANLEISDWYFNRTIALSQIGFDNRCRKEIYGESYQRDDKYWFRAAFRKLIDFQRLRSADSLEKRRIIIKPNKIQKHWLELRDLTSEENLICAIRPLFEMYRLNFNAWARYFYDAETNAEQLKALKSAERIKGLTGDTLQCIHDDYSLRVKTPVRKKR